MIWKSANAIEVKYSKNFDRTMNKTDNTSDTASAATDYELDDRLNY